MYRKRFFPVFSVFSALAALCAPAPVFADFSLSIFGGTLYAEYPQQNFPSPWTHTGDDELRQLYLNQFNGGSPVEAGQLLEIDRQRDELRQLDVRSAEQDRALRQLDQFRNQLVQYNKQAVQGAFRPAPIPDGIAPSQIERDLQPLVDAVADSEPLQAAKAVRTLEQKIQGYSRIAEQHGLEKYRNLANYLHSESRRVYLNSHGVIRGLPYYEAPSLDFALPANSPVGAEIRAGVNETLAAGSVLSYYCEAQSEDCGREMRATLESHVHQLINAYYLLDRMAYYSAGTGTAAEMAVNESLETLQTITESLSGLAEGVLDGTVSMVAGTVDGVVALVTDLPGVVEGIYQSVVNLDATFNLVKSAVADRWNAIIDAESAHERARLIGELVPEVAATLLGGAGAVSKLKHLTQAGGLLRRGIGKAVLHGAVDNAVDAYVETGQISRTVGRYFKTAAEADPEIGRRMLGITRHAEDIYEYTPLDQGPLHRISKHTHQPVAGAGISLDETVASTFRSGTYLTYTTREPIRIFRTYSLDSGGNHSNRMGRYWSKVAPSGPTQAVLDSGLDPTWGNRATHWVEIEIPAGRVLHEGIVAPITNPNFGVDLLGGGGQIYLSDMIPNSWIKRSGEF